jgi:hypothetical protein
MKFLNKTLDIIPDLGDNSKLNAKKKLANKTINRVVELLLKFDKKVI